MDNDRVVTCVYCGQAYPEGTPTHGAQILKDHIRMCPEHPMRELEEQNRILKKALLVLLNMDKNKTLENCRNITLKFDKLSDSQKNSIIDAIDLLIGDK
jgi:hypothetical protein